MVNGPYFTWRTGTIGIMQGSAIMGHALIYTLINDQRSDGVWSHKACRWQTIGMNKYHHGQSRVPTAGWEIGMTETLQNSKNTQMQYAAWGEKQHVASVLAGEQHCCKDWDLLSLNRRWFGKDVKVVACSYHWRVYWEVGAELFYSSAQKKEGERQWA